MEASNKLLSEVIAFKNYAKYKQHEQRRETLEETISRNMSMHLDRFPKLSKDIVKAYQRVYDLKVMPSMRAMQFAGDAVIKNNARSYNCSFLNITDIHSFSEALFLLLSGVGVGYSVQKHHINQLPKVILPREQGEFIIHDSIQGWAQAVEVLMDAYFHGRILPQFNYTRIRPKGAYLVTTGAKAPGPEPLRKMLEDVEQRLKLSIGRKLKPIEVHDIICIISEAVLAGGIRRSACISLFDADDEEMLSCKSGDWWIKHPYRARANNSAVLLRNEIKKEQFEYIFDKCIKSNSGEPGFFFSNSREVGTNPCVTGDTEILTKNGYVRIDSVVDTEVEVWNGFEWSKVTPKITGYNEPVLTVVFNDGRSLTCTYYHSFHIARGYTGDSQKIKAKELEVGMKLLKHDFPIIDDGVEVKDDYAYTQGFVSAEGMDGYNFLWLYSPKKAALNRLAGETGPYNLKEDRYSFKLKYDHEPKKLVPFNWNLRGKLNWLAGLFDGDGCELKEGGLQLCSVDRSFLLNLQKLLSTLGIQSKVTLASKSGMKSMPNGNNGYKDFYCKDSFRICVGAVQMQNLKELGLKCERLKFNKTPQRDASQYVTVVDIIESGVEQVVYCFNEPKRHLGIFNGILTGQCGEISLNSNQFCNLTTVNQTGVKDKRDFLNRIYAATLIGTLQASYTDFPYLRPKWKEVTETEALIGVSFTGIADNPNLITADWLNEGAELVRSVNEKYAKRIGINSAARTTTVKPEGTASLVLGSSSGIHARHAPYYLRRFRVNKDESVAVYLKNVVPELVEDDVFSSNTYVVTIPQKSPDNAVVRNNETGVDVFNRVLFYQDNWINPGHVSGVNKHNVSVTINYRPDEVDVLRKKLWQERNRYTAVSLLPYDGGVYQQAPFEECTEERYKELLPLVKEIDLRLVKEGEDKTERVEQIACSGGVCEIT